MLWLFRYFWILLPLLLIFGEQGRAALRLEVPGGNPHAGTRFSLANGRGDVTTQVDVAGNITWQASYEDFGTRAREKASNPDSRRANGLSRATAYPCTLRAVFLGRFAVEGSDPGFKDAYEFTFGELAGWVDEVNSNVLESVKRAAMEDNETAESFELRRQEAIESLRESGILPSKRK